MPTLFYLAADPSKIQIFLDQLIHVWPDWVSHLKITRYSFRTGLTGTRDLLFQRKKKVKEIGLISWVVASHVVVIYRMKWPRGYRRFGCYSPISGTCSIEGLMHTTSVKSVVLNSSETRPLWIKGIQLPSGVNTVSFFVLAEKGWRKFALPTPN